MKRILAPLAATGLVLASTAAQAAPAIDRAPASIGKSEQLFGGDGTYPNGILMLLLAGAVVMGIFAIVESGDDGPDLTPLPLSP